MERVCRQNDRLADGYTRRSAILVCGAFTAECAPPKFGPGVCHSSFGSAILLLLLPATWGKGLPRPARRPQGAPQALASGSCWRPSYLIIHHAMLHYAGGFLCVGLTYNLGATMELLFDHVGLLAPLHRSATRIRNYRCPCALVPLPQVRTP